MLIWWKKNDVKIQVTFTKKVGKHPVETETVNNSYKANASDTTQFFKNMKGISLSGPAPIPPSKLRNLLKPEFLWPDKRRRARGVYREEVLVKQICNRHAIIGHLTTHIHYMLSLFFAFTCSIHSDNRMPLVLYIEISEHWMPENQWNFVYAYTMNYEPLD